MDEAFKAAFEAAEKMRQRGAHGDAASLYARALSMLEATQSPQAFEVVSTRGAFCAFKAGQTEMARQLWQGLIDAADVSEKTRVDAAGHVAAIAMNSSDWDDAVACTQRALEIACAANHGMAEAMQHGNLGLLAMRSGELADARRHLIRAADIFEREGAQPGVAQVWVALGELAVKAGDHRHALEHFGAAFEKLVGLGQLHDAAVARANMAHLLRRQGRIREAVDYYLEVQAVLGAGGDSAGAAALDLAHAMMDAGDWPEAKKALSAAANAASRPDLVARVDYAWADYWSEMGALHKALKHIGAAAMTFENAGNSRGLIACEVLSARLSWRLGEDSTPLDESAYVSHESDTQVAVDAFVAERMFASGQLEGARELSAGFEDKLRESVERVRLIRAQVFVTQIDVLLGTKRSEALERLCLEAAHELSAQGANREALSVLLQPALMLLLTGGVELAAGLMKYAEPLLSEHCPDGWHRQWRYLSRFLNFLRGAPAEHPEEGEESEDVETAALEAYLNARFKGDASAGLSAIGALKGLERHFLASLLEGLA